MVSPLPYRTPITDPLSSPVRYLIPMAWIRWFLEIKDAVDTIDGGSP